MQSFWSAMDVSVMVLSLVIVVSQLAQNTAADRVITSITKNPTVYYNVDILVQWEEFSWAVLGFLVFFFNVRILKLLQFSRRLSLFVDVLDDMKKELYSFGLFFIVLFTAFTTGFYLILFRYVHSYRSLLSSANSLLKLLLGYT